MSTSVPVPVVQSTFMGSYGASLNAVFEPLKRNGEMFLHFPSQKDKRPTGQYFTVKFHFNGQDQTRVVMRASVPSAADARAPAVGDDKRAMSYFMEQWLDPESGVLKAKRVEGNPEHQTIKYTLDSGEDSFFRKGWRPATPDDVFAAADRAVANRAAFAQRKADQTVSVKNVTENVTAMITSMFRDVFKGNAEAMQAAVASAVTTGGGKQKKEG